MLPVIRLEAALHVIPSAGSEKWAGDTALFLRSLHPQRHRVCAARGCNAARGSDAHVVVAPHYTPHAVVAPHYTTPVVVAPSVCPHGYYHGANGQCLPY